MKPMQASLAPTPPPEAKPSWGFERGDEIAPHRTMQAPLGGGARFEVVLAWNHRRMTRSVVKVLRPHLVDDPRATRSMLREGRLLGRLEHPGLPRLYDMDDAGARPFIEIEHVDGPRLSTVIRLRGPLDAAPAIAVGRHLAATLAYLHRQGIVHLDVKPSNIVMGATPRLIDLSTARRLERTRRINGFVGTDAYMSPEQADPARWPTIGPRSDTWGLGATLYRVVTGRLPHSKGNRSASGAARFPQLVESPAPLDSLRHSPRLVHMNMASLQRSPHARPTMDELLDRLDELAAVPAGSNDKGRHRDRPSS